MPRQQPSHPLNAVFCSYVSGRDFFKLVRDMDLFDGELLRPDNVGDIFCKFVPPSEPLMDGYEVQCTAPAEC